MYVYINNMNNRPSFVMTEISKNKNIINNKNVVHI